jgi:NADPH:quinone reductase-like Zn-dependent oxidoreductase/acyl carrier protein
VTGLRPGDRVVAVAGGSLASHVTVPTARVAPLPSNLTFEQAATLPVAGFTALHALLERARLRSGERVLIHNASGGVGFHAVALARAVGAEILATAGSPWKRAYLRSLGIRHVFDSRTPRFAAGVMAVTGGTGVDVVLNSLTGDAIPAGLSVLKPGGRFVEIGRSGAWTAEEVATRVPHVTYHIVSLDRVDDAEGGRLLRAALDAAAAGDMAPVPLSSFPMARAAEAFRLMQQARHIGKIVLTNPEPFAFRPERGYLVTGGLGGLGLAVAEWAVERGARHLALVSRHSPDQETARRLEALRARGAAIHAIPADIADSRSAARLFEALRTALPPLAGVFHAAGVLDDAPLAGQDATRLARVLGPKLEGARNLERLDAPLDAFVLFSSAAGLLGSPGQANHAAANTALDAIAQRRRAEGLSAVAIDWGAWRDIGAAARRNVGDRLAATGMGSIAPAEGLAALAWALDHAEAQVAVLPIDWTVLRARLGDALPPIFRTLSAGMQRPAPAVPAAIEVPSSGIAELAALPPARRTERIARLVEEEARRLLSLGDGRLRHDRPLNELGLDSLLAVELRNRLGALAGSDLPATLLFNYPTVAALAGHLATLLAPGEVVPQPTPAADPPVVEEELLSLNEDDLDAILRDMEERHLTS